MNRFGRLSVRPYIYRVSQKKVTDSITTHNFTKNGPIFEFFFSWPRFRSEVPRGNDIFLIKLEFHQKNWLQTNLLQN